MLRPTFLVLLALALGACSAEKDAAKQLLTDSLAIPKDVEFRDLQSLPGEVVCGEYSAYMSHVMPKQDFTPFITVRGELLRTPSSEQLAVFCSPDPAGALLELTGVGPYTADNEALAKITADLSLIAGALETYYADNSWFPSGAQGLQALVEKPTTGRTSLRYREGGYLGAIPDDPWGRPYLYQEEQWAGSKGHYRVSTLGADGAEGGGGANSDVSTDILPYLQHVAHVLGQR